jgi:hypothetical protein
MIVVEVQQLKTPSDQALLGRRKRRHHDVLTLVCGLYAGEIM